MKSTLDIIAGCLLAAPIIWMAWTFIRHPLPRKRANCPVGLFIDAVVRDANRNNK